MKAEEIPTKLRFRKKKSSSRFRNFKKDKYGRNIYSVFLLSKVWFFCYILTPGLICSVIRFTRAFFDKGKEVGDDG